MDAKASRILESIALLSLEKCAVKLSRISAGKWSVSDVRVSTRSMEETIKDHASERGPGAAVYFEIAGEHPFTAMIVFRPEDIDTISRGFLGFSFSKLPSLSQAQELLLSELGNIILNSIVSSLSNALKRAFLPSAPKCVQGEPRFLLEALWTSLGSEKPHRLVTVALDLDFDKSVTRSEVLVLIPESMEKALTGASEPY
ncbi:MAG: hypothetical protein A2X31_09735 [Elusimicrobia bacterium GWB2_63_22]|nr:MAG: hypothetical protein A2X31_09735 [Elusimicrobia bacterium GWB2_63_22]HBT82279.1 hypothetical protein [Desulfuromonas sp.]